MRHGDRAHLAVFLPDLSAGGVARATLDLAAAFSARGHRVDLLLCRAAGAYLEEVAESVKVVELPRSPLRSINVLARAPMDLLPLFLLWARSRRPLATVAHLAGLVDYLRRERPHALLAAKVPANLAAVWAAGQVDSPPRIVLSERTHLPSEFANRRGWGCLAPAVRRNYRRADVLVAVSDGVADALADCAEVARERVVTIHNGVANAALAGKANEAIDHVWFRQNAPPVILSAGRLEPQKDYGLLLRAFARVREERAARLVILGEGSQRAELERLARELGVFADVCLPGFVSNPFPYMARSAVFALSSAWEGLPNVLIQALSLGCPIVSTDCPSGPAEILDKGAYGRLVPVGDCEALAQALVATLDESPRRDLLREQGRRFSIDRAAERYLDVLLGDVGCREQ